MTHRRRTLGLLAAAATTAGIAAIAPLVAFGGPGVNLPDLRADPPDGVMPASVVSTGGQNRLVVRFDGYVTNVGNSALHLEGNPQLAPGTVGGDPATGAPKQWSFPFSDAGYANRGAWVAVRSPEVVYAAVDGHQHWHYQKIMRYSLWNTAHTAEVAPGQKVGFCLYDLGDAPGVTPIVPIVNGGLGYDGGGTFCQSTLAGGAGSGATSLQMGISPTQRDVYDSNLFFQWVDISETAPGVYHLAADADPEDRVAESNEVNPRAFNIGESVTVPGYNALPVGPLASPPSGGPVAVTLAANSFAAGAVANRRFRITQPPAHGTLNVATGVDLTSPSVTYAPNAGYRGPDSFGYVARRTTSAFPLNPASAAVTITGDGSLGVAISGAPAALFAGTSAQLSATVINGTGSGVTWTVNGVPGGNATVGTITPAGLYRAPAKVPFGGRVTIRATSTVDTSRFAELRITIKKSTHPPIPGITGVGTTVLIRQQLAVGSRAEKAGRITVTGTLRGTPIGRCTARLTAGQRHQCNLRLRPGWNKKQIAVKVVFNPDVGRTTSRIYGPTKLGPIRGSVAANGLGVLKVRSLRQGRLIVAVFRGTTRVARCRLNAPNHGTTTCRFTLARRPTAKLRVVATLIAQDGLRATSTGRI
jgi:hypothetical protein